MGSAGNRPLGETQSNMGLFFCSSEQSSNLKIEQINDRITEQLMDG